MILYGWSESERSRLFGAMLLSGTLKAFQDDPKGGCIAVITQRVIYADGAKLGRVIGHVCFVAFQYPSHYK